MSKVLVSFIQDRSGSMASVWNETVNGFEIFLKELKAGQEKDGTEYIFSLTCFDTQIDQPIAAQKLDGQIDSFVTTFKQHGPRGSTALYDAAGKTIKAIEDNRNGAEKIIVVICTDGQENSSREWSKDALHSAIDAKVKAGDWTFTYLGTQPETWDEAMSLGVGAGATSTFDSSNTRAAYGTVACAVNALSASRASGSRSMLQDFTTRTVRAAANMKTATDNADDKKAIPTGKYQQTPRPTVKPRIPVRKPSSNKSSMTANLIFFLRCLSLFLIIVNVSLLGLLFLYHLRPDALLLSR